MTEPLEAPGRLVACRRTDRIRRPCSWRGAGHRPLSRQTWRQHSERRCRTLPRRVLCLGCGSSSSHAPPGCAAKPAAKSRRTLPWGCHLRTACLGALRRLGRIALHDMDRGGNTRVPTSSPCSLVLIQCQKPHCWRPALPAVRVPLHSRRRGSCRRQRRLRGSSHAAGGRPSTAGDMIV